MQGLTIAFDLDGTLVETAPDLAHATNHTLAFAGLPPVPLAQIRDAISFGSRAMIVEGLRIHGAQRSEADIDQLQRTFLAHYADNIAVSSHAFPGLEGALESVARDGAKLVVVTNKQEALSVKLLDALGLRRRFAFVAGRDTFAVCKPHPDHLTQAIRRAGGDPARAIMVGDSETDVKTARAARIPVIGVPFGYTDVPMHALGPDALMEHYDELPATVRRLLAAR